jgi:hypothetical protein
MTSFKTPEEQSAGHRVAEIFDASNDDTEIKLENFPKYVRRQSLKRFLAMYEVFKLVLPVKGSVVDCGTYRGFSLMTWAKLSTILEPENLTRRVYAFDSFQGFPETSDKDRSVSADPAPGELASDSYEELSALIDTYDRDRFLGHMGKVELIKGDAVGTIPDFMKDHPHLVVSLLFLDFDLYEPTKVAIENFLPRMPKGAIIAFDELDNPIWPGETLAALETAGLRNLELKRLEWDPYISFAVL